MLVLSMDTMERDPLSQDFVRNMQTRVQNLKYWNNGLNHIVFTLYTQGHGQSTQKHLDLTLDKPC